MVLMFQGNSIAIRTQQDFMKLPPNTIDQTTYKMKTSFGSTRVQVHV